MDEETDPAAVAANVEPARAVLRWIESLRAADFSSVWSRMTPDFRLAMIQAWISQNPAALKDQSAPSDRDELALALASVTPEHELWVHAARVGERELRVAAGSMMSAASVAAAGRPRIIGPDLMAVLVLDPQRLEENANGVRIWAPGSAVAALPVLVEFRDSDWLIAAVGPAILRPGWPPTFESIPDIAT